MALNLTERYTSNPSRNRKLRVDMTIKMEVMLVSMLYDSVPGVKPRDWNTCTARHHSPPDNEKGQEVRHSKGYPPLASSNGSQRTIPRMRMMEADTRKPLSKWL